MERPLVCVTFYWFAMFIRIENTQNANRADINFFFINTFNNKHCLGNEKSAFVERMKNTYFILFISLSGWKK